jgi:small-conductance mechanosensitive channel
MDNPGGPTGVDKRKQTSITVIVLVATIGAFALALLIPASGALDAAVGFLSRWFFAIFCTLYAFTQARVYVIRRRHQARMASYLSTSVFGFFAALWFTLAIAAVAFGFLRLEGWWEVAAWATIVVVICVQLFVLGRLVQTGAASADRSSTDSD